MQKHESKLECQEAVFRQIVETMQTDQWVVLSCRLGENGQLAVLRTSHNFPFSAHNRLLELVATNLAELEFNRPSTIEPLPLAAHLKDTNVEFPIEVSSASPLGVPDFQVVGPDDVGDDRESGEPSETGRSESGIALEGAGTGAD